jgi:predicted RNA binding protein YcfA (HicA-like mRNA interferase family)
MPHLPACTPKDVIRVLGRAGFVFDHATGSHHYYRHPDRPQLGLITVAIHRKDLKRTTLHSIIKQAGLTRDHFLELL